MKNSAFSLFFIALSLALGIYACDCDEAFPFDENNLPQTAFFVEEVTYFEDGNSFGFRIRFNKPVDSASVVPGKSFKIQGTDVFFSGDFRLEEGGQSIFVENCAVTCFGLPGENACRFDLELDGDLGAGDDFAIRSASQQLLDGDRNGEDGGVFFAEMDSFFLGCRAFPPFVLQPSSDTMFTIAETGAIIVEVIFSASMDTSTITDGTVYMVTTDTFGVSVVVPGSIVWLVGTHKLLFVTDNPYFQFCNFNPDCEFQLIITDEVKSEQGVQLDGNFDGAPGKNFSIEFSIIG